MIISSLTNWALLILKAFLFQLARLAQILMLYFSCQASQLRPAHLSALAERPLFTSALKPFLAHIRKPLFRISPKSVPENSISPFWGSQIQIRGKAKIHMRAGFLHSPKTRFVNPSMSRCKVVYRVWGKLVYPQNNLIFMLFSERFYMIKSQFYHARNPDITRFYSSMPTKKDLEDFTLQGLIFYVAGG